MNERRRKWRRRRETQTNYIHVVCALTWTRLPPARAARSRTWTTSVCEWRRSAPWCSPAGSGRAACAPRWPPPTPLRQTASETRTPSKGTNQWMSSWNTHPAKERINEWVPETRTQQRNESTNEFISYRSGLPIATAYTINAKSEVGTERMNKWVQFVVSVAICFNHWMMFSDTPVRKTDRLSQSLK